MSEPVSDASMLFTPTKSSDLTLSDSDPPAASSPVPLSIKPRLSPQFFITPPVLPAAQKEQYKAALETKLTSNVEFDARELDKIIGEYREGPNLYYFARFKDGVAHKVRVKIFLNAYFHFYYRMYTVPCRAVSS